MRVAAGWEPDADVSLHQGDTLDLLCAIPDESAQLVITSPPYNLAKAYERGRRLPPEEYLVTQAEAAEQRVRILRRGGSNCWPVGNHATAGEVARLGVRLE